MVLLPIAVYPIFIRVPVALAYVIDVSWNIAVSVVFGVAVGDEALTAGQAVASEYYPARTVLVDMLQTAGSDLLLDIIALVFFRDLFDRYNPGLFAKAGFPFSKRLPGLSQRIRGDNQNGGRSLF